MSNLIVQKYGGSSLAKPEQIQAVAARISELARAGHELIIVVSAMGKTTDQLIELAYNVSPTPNRREFDMLLSTGERVSMALMSMAINDAGHPAISFTGSQAGVLTDELHSNARIIDMKPVRIEAELMKKHIVVLAGFQGVSPRTKEITTLGRGGSDTTAVAMAAHFKAERCEIRKDVDGVYSADPNAVDRAEHIPALHYDALLDMTYWGAKVLHYRSVELAALMKIPVLVGLAHGEGPHTLISGDAPMYEQARILSVNTHKDVRWLHVACPDLSTAFQEVAATLKSANLPLPQFLDSDVRAGECVFLITSPLETLNAISQACDHTQGGLRLDERALSSVTATCQGAFASPVPIEISNALGAHQVKVEKMLFSAMSVTAIIESHDRDRATALVHALKFV
jgi:aspartate kinase